MADHPLPHVLRERVRSAAFAGDLVLAVGVTVIGLARDSRRFAPGVGSETPLRPYLLTLPPWAVITAHLLGGVLLLGRRRRPEAVTVLLALLAIVVPVLATLAVTYSVVRYGRRLPISVALGVLAVLACLGGADLLALMGTFRWTDGDPYTLLLVGSLLMVWGLYRRAASDLRAAVAAQVAQAAGEQRLVLENERLRDRAALAIELHDEVARHLSLLTLTATRSDDELDEAGQALRLQVLSHGRAASDALYVLIRALTAAPSELGGSPVGPPDDFRPAHDGPAALVALGLLDGVEFDPQDLTCHSADHPAWPVVAAVAAEGVVNARRHAAGSTVRLSVSRADDALRLVVANTAGTGSNIDRAAPGAGLGLRSARLRCEALGGSLEVRPDPDGGLRVIATVPAPIAARP